MKIARVHKNIHSPPTKGNGNSGEGVGGGGGGSLRVKKFKVYEAKLDFPGGWGRGVVGQMPSMRVWIFSGTTQYFFMLLFQPA